jgi:hypothetical protein
MTKELQQTLVKHPALATVHVNAAGQWLFHSKPGYDKVLTRQEVLAMKAPDAAEERDSKTK